MSQRAGLQSRSPLQASRPCDFAEKSCSASPSCWRSPPPAWVFAYLGFEGVSAGVDSYRNSVAEADLARNIDRELISYRGLARYYVVTGKEDDGKAALQAEASLKEAIDQAMKNTGDPARLEGVKHLAGEFDNFAATFADILKAQGRDRADRAKPVDARRRHAAPKARRSRQHRLGGVASGRRVLRQAGGSAVSVDGDTRQYFCPQFRRRGRQKRAGGAEICREHAAGDPHGQCEDRARRQGSGWNAGRLPASPRQAGRKHPDDRRSGDPDDRIRRRDHAGIERDEGGSGFRSAAA